MVNPMSSSPFLTQKGYKWFFRTGPHDVMFSVAMFKFMNDIQEASGVKIETLALVYENTKFGTDAATVWKDLNDDPELGGYTILGDVPYPAATISDASAEVTQLKIWNPDVVLAASYLADSILFQRTYKELDFNPKLILVHDSGHTNPGFIEGTGKDGDYITSRLAWNWDIEKPKTKEFDEKYMARYGNHPTGISGRCQLAMMTVYLALEKAGSLEPENIRQALLSMDITGDDPNIATPYGVKFAQPGEFDAGQNIRAEGVIGQLYNGEYHTVWPLEMAAMEVVFPQPTWAERG